MSFGCRDESASAVRHASSASARATPGGRSACTTVRCAGTGHRPEGDAAGDVPPPAFELFGTSRCDPRAVGTVPAHMSRFAGDAAARGDGAPKVSVVVPVFDPGP